MTSLRQGPIQIFCLLKFFLNSYWVLRVLYIFFKQIFHHIYNLKLLFLQSVTCLFTLLLVFLKEQIFNFLEVQFTDLFFCSFVDLAFCTVFKKSFFFFFFWLGILLVVHDKTSLPNLRSWRFSSMFPLSLSFHSLVPGAEVVELVTGCQETLVFCLEQLCAIWLLAIWIWSIRKRVGARALKTCYETSHSNEKKPVITFRELVEKVSEVRSRFFQEKAKAIFFYSILKC